MSTLRQRTKAKANAKAKAKANAKAKAKAFEMSNLKEVYKEAQGLKYQNAMKDLKNLRPVLAYMGELRSVECIVSWTSWRRRVMT